MNAIFLNLSFISLKHEYYTRPFTHIIYQFFYTFTEQCQDKLKNHIYMIIFLLCGNFRILLPLGVFTLRTYML